MRRGFWQRAGDPRWRAMMAAVDAIYDELDPDALPVGVSARLGTPAVGGGYQWYAYTVEISPAMARPGHPPPPVDKVAFTAEAAVNGAAWLAENVISLNPPDTPEAAT